MSKDPQGLGIEIAGLGEVALFMAALIPGYMWIRKGTDPKAILQRGALVGTGLLAFAIASGLRQR